MTSARPRVTVCIPTFNRSNDLEKTLTSLRDQSYENYEVLVCNDASTDDTHELLSSFQWNKLKVFHNEKNLNLYGTMERLFAAAGGTYVGMQHDHDLYEKNFLERMVDLLEQHPTAGFATCGYIIIDEEDRVVARPQSSEFRLFPASGLLPGEVLRRVLATRVHTPIAAMGTMFRRDVLTTAGGYRADWRLASDEDLYARVAAISDVAFTPDALFRTRVRPTDRHKILGSWEGLLTLSAFRRALLDEMHADAILTRAMQQAALSTRYLHSFTREALVWWSRGDVEQLRRARELAALANRPWRVSASQQLLLGVGIEALARSAGVGAWLGRLRQNHRDRKRGAPLPL